VTELIDCWAEKTIAMTIIYRILIPVILLGSILNAGASSYYNPWEVQITFQAKKGELIIPSLNRMRELAAVELEKKALGDTEHSKSKILATPDSGLDTSLVFTDDYRVEGPYGLLLTDLLYAYGCIGSLNLDEAANRYEFTVSRRTPNCRCTMFFALPDSWQKRVMKIGLNPFLSEMAFDIKRFDECLISKPCTFLLIRGSVGDCDRMRFLIGEASKKVRKLDSSAPSKGSPNKS